MNLPTIYQNLTNVAQTLNFAVFLCVNFEIFQHALAIEVTFPLISIHRPQAIINRDKMWRNQHIVDISEVNFVKFDADRQFVMTVKGEEVGQTPLSTSRLQNLYR